MKTTVTLSLDGEVKEKAMYIIQTKLKTSLSQYVNQKLQEVIAKEG